MKLSLLFTIVALLEGSKAEIECKRSSNGLVKCNEGTFS